MKALLLIHGKLNSEISIEQSFEQMSQEGIFTDIKVFYYMDFYLQFGRYRTNKEIKDLSITFLPDYIFLFHVTKFPLDQNLLNAIKQIKSKPKLIYDEGDIYGGWAKPITKSMKLVMRNSDFVSIRGKGSWLKRIQKYNSNIIYTPHCASLSHLLKNNQLLKTRNRKFVFIGNSVKSIFGNIRRLSGAKEREQFVNSMSLLFPKEFQVFGRGWGKLKTNKGPIEFKEQLFIDLNNWFHVSYEHYPNVSHYYSDRLPIALLAGQIYLTHFHEGYDEIFAGCEFIFFFKTHQEAIKQIEYLASLSDEELLKLSNEAHEFAKQNMLPEVVWKKTVQSIFSRIDN